MECRIADFPPPDHDINSRNLSETFHQTLVIRSAPGDRDPGHALPEPQCCAANCSLPSSPISSPDINSVINDPASSQFKWIHIVALLSKADWCVLLGLAGAIAFLHIAGWFILIALVIPHHYQLGDKQGVFGVGLGITAYTLGMRHAFDADHIAAIDNTTRKLLADGKRPLSVGFWFSLGHSSVVFIASLVIILGIQGFTSSVENDDSSLHKWTGIIGASVSGIFLCVIGLLNLAVLIQIVRVFRRMRAGDYSEPELEKELDKRGFLNRILGRVAGLVRSSWHMYPLGFLFGLGFDTATEVALLFLAAGAATSSIPWYAALCLPTLFAAGMTLLDTVDGACMRFAYGWAFSRPVRKIYYNIVITSLSVAVALGVGMLELTQVLIEEANLGGAFFSGIASVNLNTVGYVIVGIFISTWILAVLLWRVGRFEETWTAVLSEAPDDGLDKPDYEVHSMDMESSLEAGESRSRALEPPMTRVGTS
ncbi:hypothetical protein KFL_000920120 [Klebsormidium nitens]|uniref:Nickel/cobalt efflux system n=1 Tax=Klebsormidium nitens TaxID=105231 RepID=A0A0U9HJF1_KLENI|nr:hypothetical protein KFL_000920120 [Klebsormidium nitens]|eukprot:GAQ81827.1 hypothetical protein KFL_000920120 [Klebsormidium nitens]